MPMTGFTTRNSSQPITQQTNQRWEVDDTGKQVYKQDTTEKLSADKRCLAVRTRRRYSSYGGNQCSSKVSVKWGNSHLCKKCADELHDIMGRRRYNFVNQLMQNNLLWDDPQAQWDAYLDGTYKLPEVTRRSIEGYRQNDFALKYGEFGLDKIYMDAGKVSPFAVEEQLEQQRRTRVVNFENSLFQSNPINSLVDTKRSMNNINAYLLLKAGGRLSKNFPQAVYNYHGVIEWIDCNPYAVGDGIGLGDIRIEWTDECKLSDEDKATVLKTLESWWSIMNELRITDDELTDLSTWYNEFVTTIEEQREVIAKMTEQFKEGVEYLDYGSRRFPWLPEPETEETKSIMDLE